MEWERRTFFRPEINRKNIPLLSIFIRFCRFFLQEAKEARKCRNFDFSVLEKERFFRYCKSTESTDRQIEIVKFWKYLKFARIVQILKFWIDDGSPGKNRKEIELSLQKTKNGILPTRNSDSRTPCRLRFETGRVGMEIAVLAIWGDLHLRLPLKKSEFTPVKFTIERIFSINNYLHTLQLTDL